MDEHVYERFSTLAVMGGTRPEREDARARTAYVAATRRYLAALSDVQAAGVPLVARGGTALPSWSRVDVQVMLELHAALGELIRTRRSYDAGRRSG